MAMAKLSATVVTLAMAALLITSTAGCRSAPGIDQQFHTYYEHVPASSEHTVEAARHAIDDLNLQIISENQAGSIKRFETRNAFDTRVFISVQPAGEQSTRLGVRVHPGASEGYSLEVINQIKSHL